MPSSSVSVRKRPFLPYLYISFALLLLTLSVQTLAEEDTALTHTENLTDNDEHEEEHEIEPAQAILFPVFTLTIGVMVFYLLSRHLRALPYTAVMFLIGTIMGIGASVWSNTEDHLNHSIRLWIPIDSEVLLLVFLPGLIFKDAMGLNVHLFRMASVQCLIFAFPLVLAGTVLTALIARYIFPYDWSMDLCMAFGSILSATDPVAVAALLEQVGAPPRLKIHISGEALLNDGAAIVFFSIFSSRYFATIGIPGGEEVNWPEGVSLFCQKVLGGVAIGIFFGIGLLFLMYILDHRFSREENIVEVTATAAIAYIGFYVAEVVWETSGVIATVTLGLIIKFFGRAMINDAKLLDDFWNLMVRTHTHTHTQECIRFRSLSPFLT
jgi:NhaP-type Na+/H+ or K+/H+ antiporter